MHINTTSSEHNSHNLQFIKLGGSLITDKSRPHTVRSRVLNRLAKEIAAAVQTSPDIQLILGHGSGSFGHVPAKKFNTRSGVITARDWQGFIEVWREASELNHYVVSALLDAGLPAISFPPSSSVIVADGYIVSWDITPIVSALQAGLLPVIYGDVVFDTSRGGTILSTEDLFFFLAKQLMPIKILLAGREAGVWKDFPASTKLLNEISPHNITEVAPYLDGSQNTDVTGGMASKVQLSLELIQQIPGLKVYIFSGDTPEAVKNAILGKPEGTMISNNT